MVLDESCFRVDVSKRDTDNILAAATPAPAAFVVDAIDAGATMAVAAAIVAIIVPLLVFMLSFDAAAVCTTNSVAATTVSITSLDGCIVGVESIVKIVAVLLMTVDGDDEEEEDEDDEADDESGSSIASILCMQQRIYR